MIRTKIKKLGWTSHDVLVPKSIEWCEKNFPGGVYFPGKMRPLKALNVVPGETINVVLFGDFLIQLLQIKKWKISKTANVRLWVLSHAVKNYLIKRWNFLDKEIGVIPRFELFPLEKKTRS
ncbi:MAG: hypothetical protein K2Q18_15605 [Bdellovibrionales bacterium]|nr:hypothetical protein [Bdellovibrionales bacterium]